MTAMANGHGSTNGVAASHETPDDLSPRLRALLEKGMQDVRTTWTLPARFMTDAEVYEVEQDRVFGKVWVFLAHETEIPEPGDYVIRYISDDQFIVTRDENGKIRAHFNSCRHRGMQLCRTEMGNTSHYRCPYHGWTYNNEGKLVGVPAGKEAYGNRLEKSKWGLRQIPRLDTYKGLIFGCLDPEVQPLHEFLGDMRFYLDIVLDRSDAGLEVVGGPQRWIVDANWKFGSDNFAGDAYHTMWTHRSMVDLGLAPPDPQFALYGEHVHTENGHGVGVIGPPPGLPLPEFFGLPDNIVESIERRLTPDQVEVLRPLAFMHGQVFPNLALGNFLLSKDHQSAPASFFTLRLWHPIAADKMEIWSWFLIEKDAPDWFKEESYLSYVRTFGTSGVFEQDDAENWRSITRALRGRFGKRHDLNYQMGMGILEPDPNWRGPGKAYPLDYAEANQRNWQEYWMQLMLTDPVPSAYAPSVSEQPATAGASS